MSFALCEKTMDVDSRTPSDPMTSSIAETGNPSSFRALPAIICAVATILTGLVWPFVLYSAKYAAGSDVGRVFFAGILLLGVFAAIPLGLLNALIISPIIARPLNIRSDSCQPIIVNFKALMILVFGLAFLVGLSYFVPYLANWNFFFMFVTPFLMPPLFIGSLAYSFCKLKALRKHNLRLKVDGVTAAT
jgi:hypothetical protein